MRRRVTGEISRVRVIHHCGRARKEASSDVALHLPESPYRKKATRFSIHIRLKQLRMKRIFCLKRKGVCHHMFLEHPSTEARAEAAAFLPKDAGGMSF